MAARFTVNTAIEGVNAANGNCVVVGGSCIVNVTADEPVEVSVYALDGKLVKQENLSGNGSIAVPSGSYVVKTVTGDKTDSKVVLVR